MVNISNYLRIPSSILEKYILKCYQIWQFKRFFFKMYGKIMLAYVGNQRVYLCGSFFLLLCWILPINPKIWTSYMDVPDGKLWDIFEGGKKQSGERRFPVQLLHFRSKRERGIHKRGVEYSYMGMCSKGIREVLFFVLNFFVEQR